jgi:hypothetical protein
MNSIKRGWRIAAASIALLKANPHLVVFPMVSALAVLVILAASVPLAIALAGLSVFSGLGEDAAIWVVMAGLYAVYVVCFCVVTFVNAALIFCTLSALDGAPVSVGAGFAAALRRLPQIFAWSLVAATVGLAIRSIGDMLTRSRAGLISGLVVGLVSSLFFVAWIAASYFVLPVLAVEGLGPIAALKRSTALIKARWRDVIGGETRFGLVALVLLVPPFIAVCGGLLAANENLQGAVSWTLFGTAIAYTVALAVMLSTLGTIFLAAVYRFAVTGTPPPAFGDGLVGSALRSKAA